MKALKYFLFPIALIYKFIVQLRNIFFNIGIKHQHKFNIPIISVGNISVGGTGKTPHVEYLISLLKDKYKIAIISRGYKRKTKGFIVANNKHTHEDIGDESKQYQEKFGEEVIISVSNKRVKAIEILMRDFPDIDVILLDDAYQHRYVKPGLSILLSDYHHPFFKDHILPVGLLREPRKNYKRADIIIMTKIPFIFSPIIFDATIKKIKPYNHQEVYFSCVKHQSTIAVNSSKQVIDKATICFLVVGIANPYPLQEHLSRSFSEVITIKFPDHHNFSLRDILKIKSKFNQHFSKNKVIVTTEKDMTRLNSPEIKKELINLPLFYVPIKTEINNEKEFNTKIVDYVEKNKRNS